MKSILCLAIVATLFTLSTSAQSKKSPSKSAKATKAAVNYKVTWGPDLKLKGDAPTDILLYDENGFYATTVNSAISFFGFGGGGSEYISKFNNRLDLVLQNKIETEKSDKRMKDHSNDRLIEFGKDIYVITREKDKDNKTIVYFAEKINRNTLVPDGNKIKMYEADYSVEKRRDDVNIGIFTNKDKNDMVIYEQHPAEKETNIKLTVCGLDENFKTTWKKDVELPIQAESKKPYSFDKYVDNSGNIYLLAKVFYDDGKKKHKKDVKDGQLTYDYHIYTIGKDIKDYIDYPFNLKDKAVSQVALDVNAKGELVACGFYADINTEKDRISGAKGVFFTIIDPVNKEIKSQSYKKFDNSVFTAGMSAKKKNKMEEKMEEGKREGDASEYIIRDLVPRKDGGCTMLAEEHYIYVVTYNNGKTSYSVTHYVYNNIIISKISPSGEVEWTTVIPKSQNVTDMRNICSYIMFDEGTDTYDLFFNDHKENLNAFNLDKNGTETVTGKLKNMRFVRVVVNPDGTLSKREEAMKMSEEDEDTRLCPRVSAVVSDNEIILYGVDHRKDKFAKITFTDLEAKK